MHQTFRGIRPDDLHGRRALRNPERGFRTEMYFSTIPGEIAGMCSCHQKQLKLDGRPTVPVFQNIDIPGVPHLIRGNRLDGIEFAHCQWEDELDYFAYDGVTIMQSYCFLNRFERGEALSKQKLDDIETFFRKLRANGVKALLRFAYELSPSLTGPTAETVLKHLEQLKPLLLKYMDVIYVLQCGFVGKFGEWHSSFNRLDFDLPLRRELFKSVLDLLPPDRCTMIRYPRIKWEVYGADPLTEEQAFSAIPQARIGHFFDGFMAGASWGGTWWVPKPEIYADRSLAYRNGTWDGIWCDISIEEQQLRVARESSFLPVDGELFWRDLAGVALPADTVRALARFHFDTLGFVHGHSAFEGKEYSIDVWKSVPADPVFLIDNDLPLSDGYFESETGKHIWRSYYEYIRDHLGYRLELREADVSCENGRVHGSIRLINRGFSAPVNPRPVYLMLGDTACRIECDVRRWYSGKEQVLTFDFPAPEKTNCPVGLWLPDAAETLRDDPDYAIRCANALEFRDGVNWFGFRLG